MSDSSIAPFEDQLSHEVWFTKFRDPKETKVEDTWWRVANSLASSETTQEEREKYAKEYYRFLSSFNTVAGRILANAGTDAAGTTPFNCFILGPRLKEHFKHKGIDSLEGIMEMVKEQAITLKSEGGYGTNLSHLRPRGAFIKGIKTESCGPVAFANIWNTVSDTITQGAGVKKDKRSKGSIRKGAMLLCLEIWHPSIIEFIRAKQVKGVLDKFNISVGATDDFMEAVDKDLDFDLIFPNTEFEKYNAEWDGDIESWKKKGYPIVKYQTLKARALYEIIMESTYNRNEPGVLFLTRANKLNNLWYAIGARCIGTNPCGEQIGPDGLVCDLGALNLVNYVNDERTDWDYKKLEQDIPIHIRMLDSVNTIGRAPLEIQMESMRNYRRVGEGIMGFGSSMLLLKARYGSKKCIELTEKLAKFWVNTAYKASAMLAKEKGSFPLFDKEKYIQSEFLKCLDPDTIELIKKHGIRNSNVLSIAPTGDTGAYAQNVSGGLEPIFNPEYIRTMSIPVAPGGLNAPDKLAIDWTDQAKKIKAFDQSSISQENSVFWEWIKEGDDNLLRCRYKGVTYKIDKNRGLTKEMECVDWAVRKLKAEGKWDPKASWAAGAADLTVDEHMAVMKVLAKYVDSAISKTVNLPKNYPYEDFKKLYMSAWKTGYIKGITTYREGTMANVLKVKTEDEPLEGRLTKTTAPKRPVEASGRAYTFVIKGQAFYVVVGLLGEDPFEIFTGLNLTKDEELFIPKSAKEGKIVKKGSRNYSYVVNHDGKEKEYSLTNGHSDSTADALTRAISLALRHGADVTYVVQQLEKTSGDMTSFAKALGRALKKHIPEGHVGGDTCLNCGSKNVKREQGCKTCKDCGWSGCG